jgi:DNA-binding GntR family transcriptional regulator
VAKRGGAATLAVDVWQSLRREVLHGNLRPGTRLKPAELAQHYQVSTGVVREALTRLVEQRLVVRQHNQNFCVVTLSREHLLDLTEFRTTVEELALRLSLERGDIGWESNLIAAHHRLCSTPRRRADDPDIATEEWSQAHREFHHQLIAACGYEDLLETCTRLYDSAEVYRRWSAPASRGRRDVEAEHASLTEAALARDVPRAQRELRAHFRRTADIVLAANLDQAAPSSTGDADFC